MDSGDEPRLRRSMLMTPGNRPDRLAKAASYGADCLVYDLEDSVPAAAKAAARRCVAQALEQAGSDGRERCVRINALGSGHGADDLAALPLARLDSLLLPKVESAAEVLDVQRRLLALGGDRGRTRPIELILTLETPRGVLQALAIADASSLTSALFFGSGDYSAATGAAVTPTSLLFARSTVAAAAGAAHLQAIDAAYFEDVRDAEGTRRDALAARELGFAGKVVFHPNQVAVANQVFSPSAAELERARRIVAVYEQALAQGRGTAFTDGVFVAIDIAGPAQRLLRRAALIEVRDGAARTA
jgi:citrate lyase beta subunit